MSGKLFCPNCGGPVAEGDRFCQTCGAKLADFVPTEKAVGAPPSGVAPPPQQVPPPPQQAPPGHPVPPGQVAPPAQPVAPGPPSYYVPPSQPGVTQPAMRVITKDMYKQYKASLLKRTAAFILDDLIFGAIGFFCPIIPLFKDVIPEQGKSFGKLIMGIKVVDYTSGKPIDTGQACVRQLGFLVTLGFDIIVPFFTEDGRRVGDYMANTIVIEDI